MNPLNPMSLRTVTIWTIRLMLDGSVIVPTLLVFAAMFGVGLWKNNEVFTVILDATLLWFFSSFPLLVAYFVSKNLQCKIPITILLCSAVAYGIAYVGALCHDDIRYFVVIGFMSLPVLLPLWIIAFVIDWRCRKKN